MTKPPASSAALPDMDSLATSPGLPVEQWESGRSSGRPGPLKRGAKHKQLQPPDVSQVGLTLTLHVLHDPH